MISPLVSVITATIPERAHLLAECKASVRAQTFRRREHLVLLDDTGAGCSATTNTLASQARGEWLFPLADDDLLLPGCLAALLAAAEGYDVVYPVPLVWGEAGSQFCDEPPSIPSTALIRAEAWRSVGGYNAELGSREDHDLWEQMLQQSKRFVRYDASPTWVYRFHRLPDGSPGNKSRR